MFKLFEDRTFYSEGSTIPFHRRETRTQSYVILENVMKYWSRSSFRPDNKHLLVQILRSLEHSLETPLIKVMENLDARWGSITKHFGLTSAGSFGKPHKNVFYSSPYNEATDYIVALDLCDIDPFDTEHSWRHTSPFKVLCHPANDFKWLLPAGNTYTGLKGFSVVAVDVRLLAMQFCLFKQEQYLLHRDKAILTPTAFLINDALPKIYPSHIDQAVWNYCEVEAGTQPRFIPKEWLPVAFPDLTMYVKQMAHSIVPKLNNSRRYYVQSLESLPALFSENAHEALKLPSIPSTRQSNWIRILARWRHVVFLMGLQGRQGTDSNSSYVSELKGVLRVFATEQAVRNFQDTQLEEQFKDWSQRFL